MKECYREDEVRFFSGVQKEETMPEGKLQEGKFQRDVRKKFLTVGND